MNLTGKNALVTGGSRGIGRAVCLELARQGANVAVNYAGNAQAAEEVAAACRALGVESFAVQADVADAAAVDAMVKQVIETFGSLHILVNNAGITKDKLALSSVVGLRGNPGQANYAASKAGLIGMSKSIAKELASRNVTVNLVAPGFIDTDMTAVLPEAAREALLKSIPMGRLGQSEDVARAVAFFAAEEAGYITGQVLCVDGGMAV